ncbi:MAG: hypothetical protein IIC73_08310, partial [Armatimonadetes bacterium]|nr:hypothetical protein [Armatimonadota bacterium]
DMGAFGIMVGGDQIDTFELALDFDLGAQAYGSLGWERADGSLLGGEPVDLNWYSLDLNFIVSDDATVAVYYLFSDGLMPVTYGGISNGVWSGGVLAVQGTLRF